MSVEDTLKERRATHGDFSANARLVQKFKHIAEATEGYARLSPVMMEALDNIFQKIGRVLTGDPTHKDDWHDIQGYARLVEKDLEQ